MNGIIDEGFTQGITGDCWLLTAVYSMAQNEQGRQITKSQIKITAYDFKRVKYNEELLDYPQIVAGNKIDLATVNILKQPCKSRSIKI